MRHVAAGLLEGALDELLLELGGRLLHDVLQADAVLAAELGGAAGEQARGDLGGGARAVLLARLGRQVLDEQLCLFEMHGPPWERRHGVTLW